MKYSYIQSSQFDEIIIEKTIMTQTKSLGKPSGKKLKSDQSSLLQHFKRSTQPKMTPPPPSNDSTPQVRLFLYKIISHIFFFFKNTEIVSSSNTEIIEKPAKTSTWNQIFRPPTPPPLCSGHKERCVIRQVKDTSSANWGRYFYVCSRANGASDNPQARCDHFQWKEIKKKTN
jgi:hypothetical protein